MQKITLLLILALPLGVYISQDAKGDDMNDIIEKLIPALIEVESGGNPDAVGDNGEAVGILQIHKCVVDDVNYWYGTNILCYDYDDRRSPETSKEICGIYLRHYGYYYGLKQRKVATPEVLARIWNGGPNGWKKKSTEKYWLKVKAATKK